ncbi:histidine-rich glycoprotein-like isoform X1 [Argiope bruennichi]|uniref:histidine-rich glycoprotein-like isoform X1 n=1 Tax=Argiope bruennichi TaxID=94029 RepID=UPI00249495CB|nr:histidine-rich glycoprotein-like isoform X1 [Argiope bruennichi]
MLAKSIVILFAVCGAVSASHLYSIIGESYHAPQPYKFGYEVKDKDSTQHRHEEGDGHGNVRGTYGYTDDKGQYREVHYVADKNGFRAQVKTNEAGTANQNPADVEVKADPQHHHHFGHHGSHHHIPQVFQHNVHIPELHEVHHHVPVHHNLHIEPVHHHHHNFGKHDHHHGFNNYQHFSSPDFSYKSDTFSPLHGYSYNPSAFHHGYGHWPFPQSNMYGSWKKHNGFSFDTPSYGNGHSFNFDSDAHGFSGFNKDKYDEIMEKIKSYKHHEPLDHQFSEFKTHGSHSFDSGDKGWKYGLGNF